MSDSIQCSKCDQEFTDEDTLKTHLTVDHALNEATTIQTNLHRQHLPRGKLNFPTDSEPEDEDQGVPTTGSQGYNTNPNAGLYDNKLFRTGSSTERTSILGEGLTVHDNYSTYMGTGDGGDGADGVFNNLDNAIAFADSVNGYVTTEDEDETAWPEETAVYMSQGYKDDVTSKVQWGYDNKPIFDESKSNEFDGDEFQKYSDAKNKFENRPCRKCGERELIIISKDSVDYDESGEPIHAVVQCANCDTKYGVESKISQESDVDYEKENEQSMGFIEQQHTEPKEDKDEKLDKVDISLEKIDYVYKTKGSESEEKDHVTDPVEGLDEEYNQLEDSQEDEVELLVESRKLHGYSNEHIAKELHIIYGISKDRALEKVYSVEVSNNDKVAQTFFGKMYKDCTESEKSEMRMYSGSDY